jgi:hypothetical protein
VQIFRREKPLRSLPIVLTAMLGMALCSRVGAEEPFYLGTWNIASAVAAPWAGSPHQSDATEMKALIGKTVTLKPKAIAGPKVFACAGPHYKLSDFSADMLFQGELGELHDADSSKDPLNLAHSLGFAGSAFKTLETGCEIDWHFADPATVKIGLDNYVYTLTKQ